MTATTLTGQASSSGSGAAASPHHAAMFAFAHIFVRLHTRLSDGHHVAVMTIDPSGDAILIQVLSRDCKTYEARIDAMEMKEVKDSLHATAEVGWGAFFDMVQRCFVDRSLELITSPSPVLKLTLRHDRASELLPAPPFATTMTVGMQLASPQEGAVTKTVEAMVAYLTLRTGDTRERERIEGICRQDEQLREDAALVTAESATLRDEVRQFKAQAQAAEAQVAELTQMLSASPCASTYSEALARIDLTRISCRVPPAWVSRPAVRYNTRILKAVKVKWPFTAMITKGLPSANSGPGSDMQALDRSVGGATPSNTNGANGGGADDSGSDMALSTRSAPIRGEHLRYCNVVPADAESVMPVLGKEEEDVFLELNQMDEWTFSAHDFDSLCRRANPRNVGALYYMGYAVFMRLGLCARFNISESALLEWLGAVEAGYRNVPFHNSLHAADVLHSVYFMLAQADVSKRVKFNDLQILAVVFAAILIDFDHPGSAITNTYLRSTAPCYASVAYSGQAILENHHVAAGFELMKLPRFNPLECLSPTSRSELQSMTAQLVQVTDLERHDKAHAVLHRTAQAFDFGSQRDDPMLLLALVLKAADVGYAAKTSNVYSNWVQRRMKELGQLAELEAKEGLTVTGIHSNASADRKSALQLNFLNYVVLPTFSCLGELAPKMRVTGEFIRANKHFWMPTSS